MVHLDYCSLVKYLFKLLKFRRMEFLLMIVMLFVLVGPMFIIRRTQVSRSNGDVSSEILGMNGRKNAKDLPGYFMRGKRPSENFTYCRFNYGLPHKLDWSQVAVTGTPQLGMKSPYRVIYNAIERTMFDTPYVLEQVTYATHVTPEFLYHVVEIARFWDGPISVAAFVPDYDLELTMKLFHHLCRCYDGMSKISLHLVYPEHDLPRFLNTSPKRARKEKIKRNETFENGTEQNIAGKSVTENATEPNTIYLQYSKETKPGNSSGFVFIKSQMSPRQKMRRRDVLELELQDCSDADLSDTRTYRSRHGLIYPVNVGRNVARNASSSQYILVSDVEMVPSEDLANRFTVMIKRHKINGQYGVISKWRLAFVIPVFEVEAGEDIPRNKSSLQQLYAEGKAVYFHRWVCSHCQRIPDLQAWLKEDPGAIVKPFAITKRQFPYHRWEPIYIATKHTPWYSEALSWEGRQDKMTQMLEMCLKSYDFVVVDGAFLCHSPGIKVKSKRKTKSWRYRHELVNTKQYDLIVKGLAERYPANPKCRLE